MPVASSPIPDNRSVHIPIMVREVLECLRPQPGDFVVDCTLGGGGHAEALLRRVAPGGRLLGLDVDPVELPRTEARLRDAGFDDGTLLVRLVNFSSLPAVLAENGLPRANVILADLGTSSMQNDDPGRGFSYKGVGPLDMRMDPRTGETAAHLLQRLHERQLAVLLEAHADEPHAALIASLLREHRCSTTHGAERIIRTGLHAARPDLPRADVKMSVRRTFQALRIAVNDEFTALDRLLAAMPDCLAPGGRVAVLTFHSGEDRRVKKAFRAGLRSGCYSTIADAVVRSGKEETFANRRASAAKLRWAVRA